MDEASRGRLVRVLARAYDRRATAQPTLEREGMTWADGSLTEAWRAAVDQAAEAGLLTKLLAVVLTDPSAVACYPLLRGLPLNTFGLESLLEEVAQAATEAPDAPVDGLQAITSPSAGFGDPLAWAQTFVNAGQRIARIEVNRQARGTGLLVGPDLLLTAAHVLDRSAWPPRGTPAVTAVFDYVRTPGRSESETGLRVPVTEFLCGSLPSEAEAFNRAVLEEPPLSCLDFALLRLAWDVAAPDRDNDRPARGYYRLDQEPYAFAESGLLFIPQHPLRAFQMVSLIDRAPTVTPSGVRVRYRSNTLQGSSGSPVVDIGGNLVALHHYYGRGWNQGVPIAKIAEAIILAGFSEVIDNAGSAAGNNRPVSAAETPVADPFPACQPMQEPIANRKPLRAAVRAKAVDPAGGRTLIITGERRAGTCPIPSTSPGPGDEALDLTGPRMCRLEESLHAAYPTSAHARVLADRAGLDPTDVNWNAKGIRVIREILTGAVLSGHASAVITAVLADPSAVSVHADLHDLVGTRWLRENTSSS